MMKKRNGLFLMAVSLLLLVLASCGTHRKNLIRKDVETPPKREFRGAWIHTVWQEQYTRMTPSQMRTYFSKMLDDLQAMGINALVFQVRPTADTFYRSDIEPWSRFLTGTQGKAPADGFDPLAFLVSECRKRSIELHTWINPYRVTVSEGERLASSHIYYKHPERFVKYGKGIYFDPGIPENREFICKVVRDIVMRYDIDAIHMDDYFYPYPIAGEVFPDGKSFARYGAKQGFLPSQKNDWRRNNVNMLVREVKETILKTKPWVRFGISPFGIYRNQASDPNGSNTRGLQNYDDLYADVLLWMRKGWIDYAVPQVYWEIGHSAADYAELVPWWASQADKKNQLYIGQDVQRTMNTKNKSGKTELRSKMEMARTFTAVEGNCFWSGYSLLENQGGIVRELKNNYHRYPALVPAFTSMHKGKPQKVRNLREEYTQTSHFLSWEADRDANDPIKPRYFVVYCFADGQKTDLSKAENIVAITAETRIELPYRQGKERYKYVVTAVDAFHNESKGKSIKLTL